MAALRVRPRDGQIVSASVDPDTAEIDNSSRKLSPRQKLQQLEKEYQLIEKL